MRQINLRSQQQGPALTFRWIQRSPCCAENSDWEGLCRRKFLEGHGLCRGTTYPNLFLASVFLVSSVRDRMTLELHTTVRHSRHANDDSRALLANAMLHKPTIPCGERYGMHSHPYP